MPPFFHRGRSKYGSVKVTTSDGEAFASKLEARRWEQLKALEQSGILSNLKRQVKVKLTRANIGYIPDFEYTEKSGKVFEDTKGMATDVFLIKKRLWKVYGPGRLRIMKSSKGVIKMVEEVVPEPPLFDA